SQEPMQTSQTRHPKSKLSGREDAVEHVPTELDDICPCGRGRLTGMKKNFPMPPWMVYAREKVRPILEAEGARRPKGPSRHYENTVRSSYEKAVKDFGYEGTEHDWFYLLKYAQFPGDG